MRQAVTVMKAACQMKKWNVKPGDRVQPGDLLCTVSVGKLNREVASKLAGTVLEVCAGRLSPGEIPGILRARDRSLAGPTLSPHGLYLDRVFYPGEAAGQAP